MRLTRNTGTMPFDGIRTIRQFIRGCFQKIKKQMKIVKFGGKSFG
jgi:hypothetical protein